MRALDKRAAEFQAEDRMLVDFERIMVLVGDEDLAVAKLQETLATDLPASALKVKVRRARRRREEDRDYALRGPKSPSTAVIQSYRRFMKQLGTHGHMKRNLIALAQGGTSFESGELQRAVERSPGELPSWSSEDGNGGGGDHSRWRSGAAGARITATPAATTALVSAASTNLRRDRVKAATPTRFTSVPAPWAAAAASRGRTMANVEDLLAVSESSSDTSEDESGESTSGENASSSASEGSSSSSSSESQEQSENSTEDGHASSSSSEESSSSDHPRGSERAPM